MLLSIMIIGIICFLTAVYITYIFVKGADIRNGNQEAAKTIDDEQMTILTEMRERKHLTEITS